MNAAVTEDVFAQVFPGGYIEIDGDDPSLQGVRWKPCRVSGVECSKPHWLEGLTVARATVNGVVLYRMAARFHPRRRRRW
jgi:hypothetical protein